MTHDVEPPRTCVEQVDQFLDIEVEEVDRMRRRWRSHQQIRERAVCALASPRLDVDGGECLAIRLQHGQRVPGGDTKPHRPGDVPDHVHAGELGVGRGHEEFGLAHGVENAHQLA